MEGHELYCAGHLIEAACAYYETTGKDKLLRVVERCAEHIYTRFIKEGQEGYPGHPEVELALMKLYRLTGNSHSLELAQHFINIRGENPAFFEKEASGRNWSVWGNDATNHEYAQNHAPFREQKDAVGHAVRAVYLYTAAADLASENDDKNQMRVWMTLR